MYNYREDVNIIIKLENSKPKQYVAALRVLMAVTHFN